MALLWRLFKWLVPILVALYGVYYWRVFASRRYFEGDIELKGKTAIVTGTLYNLNSYLLLSYYRTCMVKPRDRFLDCNQGRLSLNISTF